MSQKKEKKQSSNKQQGFSRRSFLQLGAAATAGGVLASGKPTSSAFASTQRIEGGVDSFHLEEATIADMQRAMETGEITARSLVEMYLRRIAQIDGDGPNLQSLIEINPEARRIADDLDRERQEGHVRGPLHGIPIVLKDNYDTADRMMTGAGSRALTIDGLPALQDSTCTARLREAGAIIFAKANLSEWANFRSTRSVSGWSGRGRQCRNPYVIDRSPCGSSSGSAIAVSANLAAASLGTETNGSILCPSSVNGCVGIKTTVGLTSRAGVVPISHRQDCTGPMCRTVADAATVLEALIGDPDPRDPATERSVGHLPPGRNYRQFLDFNGLRGARIGVVRNYFAAPRAGGNQISGYEHADRVVEPVIQVMRDLGATVVDPANLRDFAQIGAFPRFTQLLLDEFKVDIEAYLADRPNLPVRNLQDLIDFNNRDAAAEMPYFQQELFILAQTTARSLESPEYLADVETVNNLGGRDGIDDALSFYNVDALFTITRGTACTLDLINGDRFFVGSSTPGAIVGYPTVTVPAGYVFGLPIGVSFFASAWSEPTLITFAYALEQALQARRPPRFLPTIEFP